MGAYFPSRYEDVRAIAYDTQHFSSRRVVVRETRQSFPPAPPITSDRPSIRPAKQVLLPAFTPAMIAATRRTRRRHTAASCLTGLAAERAATRGPEYAAEIPAR